MKDAFFSTKLSYYEHDPGLNLASKEPPVVQVHAPSALRFREIVLPLILVALPFCNVHLMLSVVAVLIIPSPLRW